jgi:hypothetical protein
MALSAKAVEAREMVWRQAQGDAGVTLDAEQTKELWRSIFEAERDLSELRRAFARIKQALDDTPKRGSE